MPFKFYSNTGRILSLQGTSVSPFYGTTLPTKPFEGQEAVLVDSTTNPSYQWRFRYNSISISIYKWEFVGGIQATSEVATSETTSSTSYTDLSTVGPSITVPRAGDYLISFGCSDIGYSPGTWGVNYAAIKIGAAATADANALIGTGSTGDTRIPAARAIKQTLAANDVIKIQYKISGSPGPSPFSKRWLNIIPIRVS